MKSFKLQDLPPALRNQAKKQLKPKMFPDRPFAEKSIHEVIAMAGCQNVPRGTMNNQPKYNPMVITAYFTQSGLPPPEYEIRFDKVRKWLFDIAWPAHKLALEVEGGIHTGGAHARPQGIMRDICKYNQAQVLGWRVLRVVPEELCNNATLEMLKKCLCAHG